MSRSTMPATILVVDDEAALRELLVMALISNGFDAVGSANIQESLACLQSRDVDLMLLDLGLGNESGIDLLKAVRRLPKYKALPVILLTCRSDKNMVLEIAHLSVQGYVLKSRFSHDDLVARINKQLGNQETASPTAIKSQAPRLQVATAVAARSVSDGAIPANFAGDSQTITPPGMETASTIPDSLRSLRPIISREQMLVQIGKCAELKALSPTVAQLMNLTVHSDCSLEEIAQIVKRDQAIALKVLAIANSVAYNRGGSVDTVQKALLRIGVSQIRQVVLNISVVENFQLDGHGFDSGAFWEHAIATGLIAAAITHFRNGNDRAVDRAYTLGFLHDVARMVFVEQLGEVYRKVLDTALHLQLPLEQVETRMLGLNHADLMDRVLNAWKFPKSLIEPIAMHHLSIGNIRVLSAEMVAEAGTLALADRLAHAMLLGSSGNNCQYPTEEFAQFLKLESEAIKFIENKIPGQTMDMKYAMLQTGNGAPTSDYRQFVLKQFQHPVRALYISTNSRFDAYRIFLERLKEPADHKKPNIAVMQLTNLSDQRSLFKLLGESEEQAGSKPLPLIIISPFAELKLDSALLAERAHRFVPSPFAVSRLADAVNSLLSGAKP